MKLSIKNTEIEKCRKETRELLHKWKNIIENYDKEHFKILKQLFGKVEDNVFIEQPFLCDYGKNIYIGKNTFINRNCVFLDNDVIQIGENCLFAPSVQIMTSHHPVSATERISVEEIGKVSYTTFTKPVIIDNNVWIGAGAILLPGIRVGENSVVGAGSVVTKNVPPNTLVYGNPARIIKQI